MQLKATQFNETWNSWHELFAAMLHNSTQHTLQQNTIQSNILAIQSSRFQCQSFEQSSVEEMQLRATLPGPTAQRVLSPSCLNKEPHHHHLCHLKYEIITDPFWWYHNKDVLVRLDMTIVTWVALSCINLWELHWIAPIVWVALICVSCS